MLFLFLSALMKSFKRKTFRTIFLLFFLIFLILYSVVSLSCALSRVPTLFASTFARRGFCIDIICIMFTLFLVSHFVIFDSTERTLAMKSFTFHELSQDATTGAQGCLHSDVLDQSLVVATRELVGAIQDVKISYGFLWAQEYYSALGATSRDYRFYLLSPIDDHVSVLYSIFVLREYNVAQLQDAHLCLSEIVLQAFRGTDCTVGHLGRIVVNFFRDLGQFYASPAEEIEQRFVQTFQWLYHEVTKSIL